MHARSTTMHANPQALDEGIRYIRDDVLPAVREMEGNVGLSLLADRISGHCIVTTAWRDEPAMKASAEAVRPMRDTTTEIFGGLPDVQEWEVVLVHRRSQTSEAAVVRVIWGRTHPDRMDDAIDAYRATMLPRLENNPGFCSVSLLAAPAEGRAVWALAYRDREAMAVSATHDAETREDFARKMDVAITDGAEMDLVVAHLNLPETS